MDASDITLADRATASIVAREQRIAELEAALRELADAVATEVDAKPELGVSGRLLARLTDARSALTRSIYRGG